MKKALGVYDLNPVVRVFLARLNDVATGSVEQVAEKVASMREREKPSDDTLHWLASEGVIWLDRLNGTTVPRILTKGSKLVKQIHASAHRHRNHAS